MTSNRCFVADELAAQADRHRDQPFLFFRDPRGQFGWWSWQKCLRAAGEPAPESAAERVPWSFLTTTIDSSPPAGAVIDRFLTEIGTGPGREIWLSTGSLARARELWLAAAAVRGGWAVVREPCESIPAATTLWARPTLLAGELREIGELVAALGSLTPRWRAGPWLRRRLARLRLVLVCGAGAAEAAEMLESVGARSRVLSFPPDGW